MKDGERLKYCLHEIERKLSWEKSSLWKEPEFVRLSKIISEESDISISPHTLKRLYGKIKYKKYYNPQRATKDALAKFLGFLDWREFAAHYDNTIGCEAKPEKSAIWTKKKFIVAVLVLSACFLTLLFMQRFLPATDHLDDKTETTSFSFDTTNSTGFVPYTVSVKYNIEQVASDSIYLDFDFTHPVLGHQRVKLNQQRFMYNYTYQIPGYYQIGLYNNSRELAVKNLLAMSEHWDSYLFSEVKQGFWLDNEIQPAEREGYLYYSPEYLVKNGFDINPVFYTAHRLFKEFEIDGDNFEMEVRFKNSKKSGGITCYDFITRLFCENNLSYFRLMEKGCSGFSGLKVGTTEVTGVQQNLSSFTFDDERWNKLSVIVQEKKVQIFLNEELIYSNNYQGSNGKIVGIEQVFKGTGKLDYIRLKDRGTQREFFDDFE